MRVHLSPAQGVFFDHDGTLVDSLPVLVAATNEALVANGHHPCPPAAVVAAMVLPTGPRMGFHAGVADPVRQAAMAADFYAAAWRHIARARAYPGIPELLADLRSAGCATGVVTNNQGAFVRRVVADLGLAPLLGGVVGEEDMPAPKPDPRGLLALVASGGLDPARCWFVGDSAPDAQVARAAGLRSIGVTWGTHGREALAGAGFDHLVDHPAAIAALAGHAAA